MATPTDPTGKLAAVNAYLAAERAHADALKVATDAFEPKDLICPYPGAAFVLTLDGGKLIKLRLTYAGDKP